MDVPEFTSHNILLPDGRQTRSGAELIANTGICQAALRDLEVAFGPGPFWDTTVADLGCLEGGYAAAFARQGYHATGVEVHPDNLACCEYVAQELDLPNLEFIADDVRARVALMNRLGTQWDAVFCCGLLYHLDEPVKFLHQLGEATRTLLILQTHFSTKMTQQNEGFRGHWYPEQPGTRWASHDNPESFWLGKNELLSVMQDAGFGLVYEQFDYLTSIRHGKYIDQHETQAVDRGMFVGVKL